jgi:Alpha-glutamyl/putrescinyl thymine pyrophosphorylase clade 3
VPSQQTDRTLRSAWLRNELTQALRQDRSKLSADAILRFANEIAYSERLRASGLRRLPKDDIIVFVEQAREAKDLDEAIWRAIVGAHFGRLSAKRGDATSAARFLCAFGDEPRWTWNRVLSDERAFLKWLETEQRLKTLRFGNHRKHENTNHLRRVFAELIKLIRKFAAQPTVLIKTPGANTPTERFDALMKKIDTHRFGRLGTFDLIDLLVQLDLVAAEPMHCYLAGSSGPRDGAIMVWGNLSDDRLDDLAQRLASSLGVSCFILEDALCNFSKEAHEPSCCGDPDAAECLAID